MTENAITPTPQGISYGYTKTLNLPFQTTITQVIDKLKAEGFGLLFQIDMREKLKEKFSVEFRNYVILGVCNPPMAYQSLQEEIGLGLLLPCNIIVYEEGNSSVVSAIDAVKMLSVTGNIKLEAMAKQVNEKLRRAIDLL
jgi:uncharacterized protein (DUF302 family)